MSYTDFSDDADAAGDADEAVSPGRAAPPRSPVSGGSGLPGYPVLGHPGWRAGAPGANNLLGVVRIASPSDVSADASFTGAGDPLLIKVAGGGQAPASGALGYETNSWRWHDPDAVAYDLDRKQRELAEAQALGHGSEAVGWGGFLAPLSKGLGFLASKSLGLAGQAVGSYMGDIEEPMLQKEVEALKARQAQLRGRGQT